MFGNRLGWGISGVLAALMLLGVYKIGQISQIQKPSQGLVMKTGNVSLNLETRPELLAPIQLPFDLAALMPARVDDADVSSIYRDAIAEFRAAVAADP